MSLTPSGSSSREGRSFLKWAGGKTRYARTLVSIAPEFNGVYREPFLGSGAVFFELEPRQAVLSDANEELIICFRTVGSDPHAVMALLDEQPNTPEHFAQTRALCPELLSDVERAARVIYLNKTGFRGLWRVNKKGQFNVPYGAYDRPYYNRDTLLQASKWLDRATLEVGDFERQIESASTGDWVFLDPPYVPLGGWADFKRYTREQFGPADHERLCESMLRASARGVFLTLTNSDTDFVREVFGQHFSMLRMATRRDINLRAARRDSWDLVLTNYEVAPPSQLTLPVS